MQFFNQNFNKFMLKIHKSSYKVGLLFFHTGEILLPCVNIIEVLNISLIKDKLIADGVNI